MLGPFLLILSLTSIPGEQDLKTVVTAYWDALEEKDNASALRLVHLDDWNNFLDKQPTPLVDWKIQKLEFESEEKARVTILGHVLALTGKYEMPVHKVQLWEIVDSEWRLRMPPSEHFAEGVLRGARRSAPSGPPPDELMVLPKSIRFYAISPSQPAPLGIWNGTDSEAELVRLEFDESLFQVDGGLEAVPPKTRSQIRLRYIGESEEKNLRSSLTVVLKHKEELREFDVPIVYNYFDKVAAWVLEQERAKSSGKKPE